MIAMMLLLTLLSIAFLAGLFDGIEREFRRLDDPRVGPDAHYYAVARRIIILGTPY